MTFTLDITEINGERVSVETPCLKTCSPFFVIHRPYFGRGTFDDKSWKLSHISGLGASPKVRGREAKKILRVVAGVLAALPIDWTQKKPDISGIPREIVEWIYTGDFK